MGYGIGSREPEQRGRPSCISEGSRFPAEKDFVRPVPHAVRTGNQYAPVPLAMVLGVSHMILRSHHIDHDAT